MTKTRIVVFALVSVLAFGGATMAVAGKGKKKFKTGVTARYTNPSDDQYAEGALFKGEVTSRKKRCVKNRKVVVKSKPQGEKIGSRFTPANGKFEINASGITSGRFEVTAKRKTWTKKKNNAKRVCKPATATVVVNG